MGKQFQKLTPSLQEFISKQKIFFVATAMKEGHINLSPKGIDTFRVEDEYKVLWLNLTGSGNETATHLLHDERMTLMFCAFEGPPKIVRLYGTAKVYHPRDERFDTLVTSFPPIPGTRQIFELTIELVQTSCGMGVPVMPYKKERNELIEWAREKGQTGLTNYMKEKNTTSLEGFPTGIFKT
ncbi:MAG: pyridoxamine 5'-phosphate oxidase family protein [Eudoraea sp.]|nr:pyridoxamine 5'-phosphate oxidase family protein [Eudoraea sp.]